MSRELPERPNLEHLRRQARKLQRSATAAEPEALARMAAHPGQLGPKVQLSAAQLVIAREYGFPSWPALKAEVEHRMLSLEQKAAALLEASVEGLTGRAARLLAGNPELARFDIHLAAMLGETDTVRKLLTEESATRPDPRTGWPLLYSLASSRWHRVDPARAAGQLDTAELLLDAGADPNTSVASEHGPQPVLYAAVSANNPELVELLLRRGANPNDNESLYHATEHPDHACLRLLIAHGATEPGTNALPHMLDREDAEGVRLLLGAGGDANSPLLGGCEPDLLAARGGMLIRAIEQGRGVEVARVLLEAGADPQLRRQDGMTALRLAMRRGDDALIDLLRQHGAVDEPVVLDEFLGACYSGNRTRARDLLAEHGDLVAALADHERALLCTAAEHGPLSGVELMLDLGFPIDARRADTGATALHAAAFDGRVDMVRLLVQRGAPVDLADHHYRTSALIWALVGGIEMPHYHPEGDWLGTITVLLNAGASVDGAWLSDHEGIADLLSRHGVTDETEPQ